MLVAHIEVPVLENQSRQCPEGHGTARIRGPDNISFLPILEDGASVDISAGRVLNAPKDTIIVIDTHFLDKPDCEREAKKIDREATRYVYQE